MSNETSSAGQGEGVAGVGMMVAAYVDELAADQILDEMKRAKKEGSFYFDDAAVVRQDAKGKVHIKETGDMSTGKGAGVGALIGGVIGLLGGPAGVALGAGAGAAIGGLAAHHDAGFAQDSLKELGSALVPGSSAIVVTTSKDFVEEVRKQTPDTDRMSTARELASTIHDALQARQDILLGLVITEKGIAATEVISSPTAVAVFGIGADGQGAVAGEAVSTAGGTAYRVATESGGETAYEAGIVTDEGKTVVDSQSTGVEGDADTDKESDKS
jgi:uncharacterized membrane protein